MAHFQTAPGGERISGRAITVDRPNFAVGLWGPLDFANQELDVRPDDARVTATRGPLVSNVRTWTLAGPDGARANVAAVASDGSTWDTFELGFQKAGAGGATAVSVWPITKDILGTEGADHLTGQSIPTFSHIDLPTFRHGDLRNAPGFSAQPSTVAKVGIFACSNGRLTRAVIMLLPGSGMADSVLVGVTHGFGQNAGYYSQMGWSDPLSPNLILDVGRRFVKERWAPQMLASKKNLAMMLIVRARGVELGPFAANGSFLKQAMAAIARLTGGAFLHEHVEFFTYSSGIYDLNPLVNSAQAHMNVRAIYSLDPAGAHGAASPRGAAVKQFLSGQTGAPRAGFEYLPLQRWRNEDDYESVHPSNPRLRPTVGLFDYLHNYCMPNYCLYLGIQLS